MADRLSENKKNAMAFYDLAFNESRPAEAVENHAVRDGSPWGVAFTS